MVRTFAIKSKSNTRQLTIGIEDQRAEDHTVCGTLNCIGSGIVVCRPSERYGIVLWLYGYIIGGNGCFFGSDSVGIVEISPNRGSFVHV